MKKFFSLVLALVMALSLTTAAWGAEAITTQEALDAAVANGGEIVLGEGTFELPDVKNKDITLIGAGTEKTVVDYSHMGGYQEVSGSSFVFKNMTVKCAEKGWPYPGLQHTTSVSYENCHILGTVNLFCPATFTNCTFDSKSAEHSVVTYGSDSVTFENCKFTYADRAVNCYAEDASARNVAVSFTDCTFTKVAGKDSTGAIETNSMYTKSLTLTINKCAVNEGKLWWVSSYDQLDGAKTSVAIDPTVDNGKYTGGTFNTDPAANVAEGYVVVKDGAFYKVQQAVVAPEGETATGETTNNVAESVQDAVKDAVASGSTETEVVVGETKIEFNDTTDMATFAGADAADITTQIVVEDVTETVDAAVEAAVEAKVAEEIGVVDNDDVVVAAYVEIDIHVFADGEHVGQITELPEKIRVSIPLPAGVTAEAGKKYYVAHEHDGVVELLPATIEGGYVVFYSDTFSTYAVVTQTAPTSAGVALTDKVDMVTTDAAQTKYPNVTVSVHKANAPKDTNKDGRFDVSGNVKYFMMNGQEFVQVNTVSEADYTVYVAGTKTLFGYFKAANPFYYGYGVPFNNFGDKCGQYDDEPVAGTKYYTFETNLYKAVKAGDEDFNLMVGNELVPVELMDASNWVDHVAAYSYDKNYKVVGVKCAECGAPAALVPNFASLPKNIQKGVQGVDYFAIGDGQYYYWQAPAASTDKVIESADTFDAGIAMYVGMSVMAAAGSVVVLKKRED